MKIEINLINLAWIKETVVKIENQESQENKENLEDLQEMPEMKKEEDKE